MVTREIKIKVLVINFIKKVLIFFLVLSFIIQKSVVTSAKGMKVQVINFVKRPSYSFFSSFFHYLIYRQP